MLRIPVLATLACTVRGTCQTPRLTNALIALHQLVHDSNSLPHDHLIKLVKSILANE